MTRETLGKKITVVLTACIFLTSATLGYAAPPAIVLQTESDQLSAIVEQQSRLLKQQQQALETQDRRFLEYQQKVEKLLKQQQADIDELQSRIGAPAAEATATKQQAPAVTQPTAKTAEPITPVGRAPEVPKESSPPEVAAIFDQPGVLTPKGTLILEPSLQYTQSSNKRISLHGYTIVPAVTIGLIDILSISRDTYVAALASRYGLTNRLELEVKIPYVYGTEESSTSPFATPSTIENTRIDGYGLGDVEFGLRYQLNQPQSGPYYIAGLRIKSDTGTDPFEVSRDPVTNLPNELTTGSGFWGVQGTLSAVLPSDPAVFFGSINYLWTIPRDVGTVNGIDYGEIDPGDVYGFNFGMGFSLNEKASFSLGYDHSVLSRNRQDGEIIPDQVTLHVGSLQLGYAYRLTDSSNLNLTLSIGVTENAPDVQLTLKMPLSM